MNDPFVVGAYLAALGGLVGYVAALRVRLRRAATRRAALETDVRRDDRPDSGPGQPRESAR